MTGDDQLSDWTKKFQSTSQSLTCTEKRSPSLFGGLLPVYFTTAKPSHLRHVLSKSMRGTENCNARSQHWSAERAQFFSVTTPNHTLHNQHFKRWVNWAIGFCLNLSIHLASHQLTAMSSSIWQLFQGRGFHNQQEEENALQELVES